MQLSQLERLGSLMGNSGKTLGRKASIVAIAAGLGAGLFGASQNAEAAFLLRLTSSAGGTTTVTDGGLGDTAAAPNQIVANTPLAGFSFVNISVALSNTPGAPDIASI